MKRFVALAVYGCTVAGEASESVDFEVRVFESDSVETVEEALKSEPPDEYENEAGELIRWPLVSILDIQPLESSLQSGDEVAGAITSLDYIARQLPQSAA